MPSCFDSAQLAQQRHNVLGGWPVKEVSGGGGEGGEAASKLSTEKEEEGLAKSPKHRYNLWVNRRTDGHNDMAAGERRRSREQQKTRGRRGKQVHRPRQGEQSPTKTYFLSFLLLENLSIV